MIADPNVYLKDVCEELRKRWPDNRTVNIVCHGHSVPAGYFATPVVDTLNAYPHLLLRALKLSYPTAVVNVIVTAIGGEHSSSGAARFKRDVLAMRPDVVTIDYGLNDRSIGLAQAERAWRTMIEEALDSGARVVLLTPTWDDSFATPDRQKEWDDLITHARQIRALAAEYGVGLADSFAAFAEYAAHADPMKLLSWSNHPNRAGHERVANELMRWFACTDEAASADSSA